MINEIVDEITRIVQEGKSVDLYLTVNQYLTGLGFEKEYTEHEEVKENTIYKFYNTEENITVIYGNHSGDIYIEIHDFVVDTEEIYKIEKIPVLYLEQEYDYKGE